MKGQKKMDSIRIALFLLVIILVIALLYVVTLPLPATKSDDSEINNLKSQIAAIEEKMEALRNDYNEKSNLYNQCQNELAKCPVAGECTNKDVNFNAVCKKLGTGTLLRVNADRKNDIVFQCITEREATYLFYSRPVNDTIKIIDSAYNELLNITDCKV